MPSRRGADAPGAEDDAVLCLPKWESSGRVRCAAKNTDPDLADHAVAGTGPWRGHPSSQARHVNDCQRRAKSHPLRQARVDPMVSCGQSSLLVADGTRPRSRSGRRWLSPAMTSAWWTKPPITAAATGSSRGERVVVPGSAQRRLRTRGRSDSTDGQPHSVGVSPVAGEDGLSDVSAGCSVLA